MLFTEKKSVYMTEYASRKKNYGIVEKLRNCKIILIRNLLRISKLNLRHIPNNREPDKE